MYAHMKQPPPKVTAVRDELPELLDLVIARAMAKSADERFASCREMIDAARAALGASGDESAVTPTVITHAVPAPAAPKTTLPVPSTPLVGRDDDLAAVLELVRAPDTRVVTLSGLGGTGKTRLALEAASILQPDFDATYFVDLAPIQDARLVGSAIGEVLGIRETREQEITETIAAAIGDRRTLFVLDNFEQVQEAASTIADVLQRAPELKVLVTSRVLLRVRGEREYAVPPLGLPSGDSADSAAVQLFVQRAQDAKPSFELDSRNGAAVAEICRRLEGIPLAIEIAAARVKLMTPEQIVGRLGEKRLSFLTGGGGGQDSLKDAIEWSYNLLDDLGKALFARLGVLVGGSSLEAAEAVAGEALGLEF